MAARRTPTHLKFLNRLFCSGLLMIGAGLGLSFGPSSVEPDGTYDPLLTQRLFIFTRPSLVVDEGHWNRYSAPGLLAPLVRLASRDGFRVERHRSRFSPGSLQGIRVLVVAGARSRPHALEAILRGVGAGDPRPAFEVQEVAAVTEWVRRGGGLLLAIGDSVSAAHSRPLLLAFGIHVADDREARPFMFQRADDTLLPHPVTDGRRLDETVLKVQTYGGSEFTPPPGVRPFLQPAQRRALGAAFEFGRGRVFVMGDPACITALMSRSQTGVIRFGMSARGADNASLVINSLRWLARAW